MLEEPGKEVIESCPSSKKLGAHMARPRRQHGWLQQAKGKWIGHWDTYVRLEDGRELRRDRQRVLGPKSKMPKFRAQEALDKLIAEDLGTFNARPDPRVTLKWFYEHRFEPLAAARWRPTTQASQPYVIRKWILGQFGDTPLNLLDRFLIQTWLNSQQQLSREMLKKIRNLFSLICEEAIDLEYLDRNPVDRVKIPEKAKDGAHRDRFLSEAEIAALEKLQGPERLVFHMLTLLGLRPGELFARRWSDWQGEQLSVTDDVWRGKIDRMKTKGSKGRLWLPQLLQRELETYRAQQAWLNPEDFIFSARRGVPLDANNYLRRVFKPKCRALGVTDITFQCFRRTCGTYLQQHGNIKVAQEHLRHARATTTLGIYTKEIPESVKRAVESLADSLFPQVRLTADTEGKIH